MKYTEEESDQKAKITTEKSKVSEEEWIKRFNEQKASGLGVKPWCRKNGISYNSFYTRLHQYREKLSEDNQLVPVSIPPAEEITQNILISSDQNGIHVELSGHASPQQLTAVIQALKSC